MKRAGAQTKARAGAAGKKNSNGLPPAFAGDDLVDVPLLCVDGQDISRAFRKTKRVVLFSTNSLDTRPIARKIKGARALLIWIQCTKVTGIRELMRIVEALEQGTHRDSCSVVWGCELTKRKKLVVIAGWQ